MLHWRRAGWSDDGLTLKWRDLLMTSDPEPISRVSAATREYVNELLDFGIHNTRSLDFCGRLEQGMAERYGRKYGVLHANGTVTMQTALMAAGIGAGDEVIVPAFTVYMTAAAVLHANAIPIIADVDPKTWTLDPADVQRKLTKRTKAIIPVSICGLAPDYDELLAVARAHDLLLVEDNAQCMLGKYRGALVGTQGDFASYSFQSSKHVTCGEGGILLCDDEELALAARKICSVGYSTLTAAPGNQTIPKEIRCRPDFARHDKFGWNFRMSELSATYALGEFERLDALVQMRQYVFRLFQEAVGSCPWIVPQHIPDHCEHAAWTFAFRLDRADVSWVEFRRAFVEQGGDGFYGAYLPLQKEPVFGRLNDDVDAAPDKYPHWAGLLPDYRATTCPNWDVIQPRVVLLKTNYFSAEDGQIQAKALKETIEKFDRS
jgi:perosamine synthetase